MGEIRPLQSDDIPEIVDLHNRVIGPDNNSSTKSLTDHFARIFIQHPWHDASLSSLVYEESDGRIVGCIGIMPRPMTFNGMTITAAISHNFIVDPGSRSSMAGLHLARRFLAGPQDLSLAEGNNTSRRIWESINGSVSLLYSLCWVKPIRPSRYVLSFLNNRGLSVFYTYLLQPLCYAVDGVLPMLLEKQLRLAKPDADGEELDAVMLRRCQVEIPVSRMLRPENDEKSLSWQLEALALRTDHGRLHKILVRNRQREAIGWYLYYGDRGRMGYVAQIGARDDSIEQVLDHLFYHARINGVIALSGQVEPSLFQGLSRKHSVFHHDGNSWMLIHSRYPEILQTINEGKAFLTRLEGEWWINFIRG